MTEWTTNQRPMSRISRRIWGGVGNRILESGALDTVLTRTGLPADSEARLSEYSRRMAYNDNRGLYQYLHRAGLCPTAVPTEWNPIPTVIAFYISNVFSGDLDVMPKDEAVDADALKAAVETVWEWSNFEMMRVNLTRTAAVMEDTFVKVAEKRRSDEGDVTAVYMQDLDPRSVIWWEADERDFLTGIRIDTPRLTSIFTGEERRHTLVEVWRKDWGDGMGGVGYYEVRAGNTVADAQLGEATRFEPFDELGYDFIPIVWTRVDIYWKYAIDQIDLYNLRSWKIDRMNAPRWKTVGAGLNRQGIPRPGTTLPADFAIDTTTSPDDTITVFSMPGNIELEPVAAPVDLAVMNQRLITLYNSIIEALPEYRVMTLNISAQIAEETLRLLMEQASQRVVDMRARLERGLVRAQMMALSIAQIAGVEPAIFGADRIGTYEDGRTDHVFNDRPVYTKSDAARVDEMVKLAGTGASITGAAKVAGYTEEEITNLTTAPGTGASDAYRSASQLLTELRTATNGTERQG